MNCPIPNLLIATAGTMQVQKCLIVMRKESLGYCDLNQATSTSTFVAYACMIPYLLLRRKFVNLEKSSNPYFIDKFCPDFPVHPIYDLPVSSEVPSLVPVVMPMVWSVLLNHARRTSRRGFIPRTPNPSLAAGEAVGLAFFGSILMTFNCSISNLQ